MVRPKELIQAVLYTLQKSSALPESTNFVGYEPDIDSEPIKLPLVEVSSGSKITVDESNTEFVGFRTDVDGNDIGRIYETLYTQDLEVSVWTAHESRFSPRDISDTVKTELFAHVTSGPDVPLRHPDDDRTLDEVWGFQMLEAERTDDLGTSPTLRRWQEVIEISASEQYLTDASEPPISGIGDLRLEYDESDSSFEEVYDV